MKNLITLAISSASLTAAVWLLAVAPAVPGLNWA